MDLFTLEDEGTNTFKRQQLTAPIDTEQYLRIPDTNSNIWQYIPISAEISQQ
jgi:hypothetical protein